MRARSAMLPLVVAGLTVAGATTARATSSVQLLEVRSALDTGRLAVVLEASAPVAYTSSQPDPFTVVVDLRHASTATTVNRLAGGGAGPVDVVGLEQATAPDGASLARVRLGLTAPAVARVRSARNAIYVEFPDAPAPPSRPIEPGAARYAEAASGSPTELTSVVAERADGVSRVRIRANGPLEPRPVTEAKDLPPRLVIDLPGVSSKVPAVVPVGKGELARVRVGTNSASPLVTRVVLDLDKMVPYRLEKVGDRELVIEVGAPAVVATSSAPVAAPRPAAPAPPAPAMKDAEPVQRATIVPEPQVIPEPPAVTATSGTAAPPAGNAPAVAAAPAPAPANPPAGSTAAALASALARANQSAPASRQAPAASAPAAAPRQAQPPVIPPPPMSEGQRAFTGHPVSLDFQGVDLRAVLRTFAEITGLNIVIDPAVQGSVDVALRDVPWDQALDTILRANQLGYAVDGTIVRIAPLTVLSAEEAAKRKLADEKALSGQLQVMTRTLNYSKASAIEPLLKNVLSQRGRTAVDLRTNTLIAYDLPEYLAKVNELLGALDQPETQVEIEARVIRTTSEFARQLGLRWGFNGAMTPELGNTTNLAFPNKGAIDGALGPLLPGRPPRDAIGLALGSINGAFNISVEISALEREGKVKTLLTPRVVTQNNVKATITRGQEIPYSTITSAASTGGALLIPTVQFRTAALTLAVTPRVTAANTVILEVDVDNGSPGQVEENGNRAINTQRAQTTVLVADGATTVIGGIQGSEEFDTERRTPGLWRLPFIGGLFKDTEHDATNEELLIFITPRIIRMPGQQTATTASAGMAAPVPQPEQ
jgi:type IV pilus assembly protein PilQ